MCAGFRFMLTSRILTNLSLHNSPHKTLGDHFPWLSCCVLLSAGFCHWSPSGLSWRFLSLGLPVAFLLLRGFFRPFPFGAFTFDFSGDLGCPAAFLSNLPRVSRSPLRLSFAGSSLRWLPRPKFKARGPRGCLRVWVLGLRSRVGGLVKLCCFWHCFLHAGRCFCAAFRLCLRLAASLHKLLPKKAKFPYETAPRGLSFAQFPAETARSGTFFSTQVSPKKQLPPRKAVYFMQFLTAIALDKAPKRAFFFTQLPAARSPQGGLHF